MSLFTNVVVTIVAFIVVDVVGGGGGAGCGGGGGDARNVFILLQHSPFQLVYISIRQNALRYATVTNVISV